jgi:hypothetical protein
MPAPAFAWINLQVHFEDLCRHGYSVPDAIQLISQDILTRRYELRPLLPIPKDTPIKLREGAGGRLWVEMPDSMLPADKFEIRKCPPVRSPGMAELFKPAPMPSEVVEAVRQKWGNNVTAIVVGGGGPPRPLGEFLAAAESKPVPKARQIIPGKHKSPAEARVEAVKLINTIAAYQKEHQCTQKTALDALFRELGHNSATALKVALSRARKTVKKRKVK